MLTQQKRRTVLLSALMTSCAMLGALSLLGPGGREALGGKGGGKGGGGGGDATITNPAFVFEKAAEPALFLTTYDGSSEVQLTSPAGQEEDLGAVWSPDGKHVAFFRRPESGIDVQDLMVMTLSEQDGVVDPAQSAPQFVVAGLPSNRLSWSPTNEILTNDAFDVIAVDLDATTPAAQSLIGFSHDESQRLLPLPPGFTAGDEIRLEFLYAVDVQPLIAGNTVTIAFHAGWDVYDQGTRQYGGFDILLIDADTSTGKLVPNQATIRNLTNPNYDAVRPTPAGYGAWVPNNIDTEFGWSPNGQQLAFLQHVDVTAQDPHGESQIVSYDFVTNNLTVICKSDSGDNIYSPNSRPSWSPDGLEIVLGEAIKVKKGTTWDLLVVPAVIPGISIRDELVINVTNTLNSQKREAVPQWRPSWTR